MNKETKEKLKILRAKIGAYVNKFVDKYIFHKPNSEYTTGILRSIIYVFTLFLTVNILLYYSFYSPYIGPLSFPYVEKFTNKRFHQYKYRGGNWSLENDSLVQKKVNGTDLLAVIPLELSPYSGYYFGVDFEILKGPMGAGLMFNMQDFHSRKKSHIVRFGKNEDKPYLVFGYFDEKLKFHSQGSIPIKKTKAKSSLSIAIEGEFYSVLSDKKILKNSIPLKYHGGHTALTTWFSSVRFDNIQLGYTADIPTVVTDSKTAPTVANKIKNITSIKNNYVVKKKTTNKSVKNKPTKGITINQPSIKSFKTYWNNFYKNWDVTDKTITHTSQTKGDQTIIHKISLKKFSSSIEIAHLNNQGGGIIFSSQSKKNHNNSQMIRFLDDGGIAWGHFVNKKFTGEGFKAIKKKQANLHTLKVVFDGTFYSITVNKIVIAKKIRAKYKSGYFGLINTNSKTVFSNLKVYGVK